MSKINGLEYRRLTSNRLRVTNEYSYHLRKFPSSIEDVVINTPFFTLIKGELTIYQGYEWDGATGAVDNDTILRGSCVHDVLCEMIHYELLPFSDRKYADREMIAICNDDGMMKLRKEWVYFGTRYVNKLLHYVGFWKLLSKIKRK